MPCPGGAQYTDETVVTSNRPAEPENGGRVLRFRPRNAPPGDWRYPMPHPQPGPVEDLTKYERPETEDDYRHRMKMNMLGLIVTIVLMVVGAWLASTLAEIQKN